VSLVLVAGPTELPPAKVIEHLPALRTYRVLWADAADIFISAGAIVAEHAARRQTDRGQVEAILRRAAEQAGRLFATEVACHRDGSPAPTAEAGCG
jgi:hypothetical protein